MKLASLAAIAFVALSVTAGCAGQTNSDDAETSTGAASTTTPITLANWISHPRIAEIRKEVAAIDKGDDFAQASKSSCVDEGSGTSNKTKVTDPNGQIRELIESYGGEDSAGTSYDYYDAKGTLRFVFTTVNDVHGNSDEYRTYLDETGTPFWGVTRHAFDPNFHADIKKSPYTVNDDLDTVSDEFKNPAAEYDAIVSCDP